MHATKTPNIIIKLGTNKYVRSVNFSTTKWSANKFAYNLRLKLKGLEQWLIISITTMRGAKNSAGPINCFAYPATPCSFKPDQL